MKVNICWIAGCAQYNLTPAPGYSSIYYNIFDDINLSATSCLAKCDAENCKEFTVYPYPGCYASNAYLGTITGPLGPDIVFLLARYVQQNC